MVPTRSSSPRQALHRMLVTFATAVLVAASLAIAPVATAAPRATARWSTHRLVRPPVEGRQDPARHLPPVRQRALRARQPERPVRLEQMPHLLNFLKDNGTFDTNDHTVLISHTGGGILSSLTGLYPNRHGQAVSNSYGYFRPDGSGRILVDRSSTGPTTRTAATRRTTRRRRRPTRTTTWSTPTRPRSAALAPCATHPRRGCRTPAPAATSATSASPTPCSRTTPRSSFRGRPATRRSRRPPAGATNINVTGVGRTSPPARRSCSTTATRARGRDDRNVGTAGSGGTASTSRRRWRTRTRSSGAVTVYSDRPDRRHDEGLRRGLARVGRGRAARRSRRPARRPANARADRLRRHRDPLRASAAGICNQNAANARPDPLPDEAGGYSGYQGALRGEVREPGDQQRQRLRQRHSRASRSRTSSASAASRASTAMFAANTLGEVAQMQEAGIPVTFGVHLRRPRRARRRRRDPPRVRTRRGRYVQQLQGLRPGSSPTSSRA